jgi:hypothetical protein
MPGNAAAIIAMKRKRAEAKKKAAADAGGGGGGGPRKGAALEQPGPSSTALPKYVLFTRNWAAQPTIFPRIALDATCVTGSTRSGRTRSCRASWVSISEVVLCQQKHIIPIVRRKI